MRNHILKNILIGASAALLTSCSALGGLFDKDNTPAPAPLVKFTPEVKPIKRWSTSTGASMGDENLRLNPAIDQDTIFISGYKGSVASINKITGRMNWRVGSGIAVTTGPAAGDGIVVVGGRRGEVVALDQTSGKFLWKAQVLGEILAAPAISRGTVVVKAVDGHVQAFSTQDGHQLWAFQQTEPSFILRGSSAPLIKDRSVFIGFANGNLAKFSLGDGQMTWIQSIAMPEGAFAIQRMIDIDADPVIYDHRIYAATYQGKIASLEWGSGSVLWSHDISSYTGMTADQNTIYISDARSHLWAFNADSGLVDWRQTKLDARTVTAPAVLGDYVVVGDAEGYLHWLNKHDGHFAAREKLGTPITAAPIVNQGMLYVLDNSGRLHAYSLS